VLIRRTVEITQRMFKLLLERANKHGLDRPPYRPVMGQGEIEKPL
jgi:hypothetical protein